MQLDLVAAIAFRGTARQQLESLQRGRYRRSLVRLYVSRRPAAGRSRRRLSVEPGEIFGFLGLSGAGKSTTQNVLIRLLDGYEGSVAVLGKDLRAWDRGYYRRIGVAFEAPNHYLKLTARENLQLFAGLHGGGTEDPDALRARRTGTGRRQARRRVLEGHARPSDIRTRASAPTWARFWTNRPPGSTRSPRAGSVR